MENSFSHTASALNLDIKKMNTMHLPILFFYQPAMLCVFFWTLLVRIVSNHRCEKVRVLKLEVEGRVTQCDNLGKLLTWRTVSVTETSKMDTVDPFTLRIELRYQQLHYPFVYLSTIIKILWYFHPDGII